MGRAAPPNEEGIRLASLRGLPICEIDTGRLLGRVGRVLYDPNQARVAGFQTSGYRRRHVAPMSAVRGMGQRGALMVDAGALLRYDAAPELAALARSDARPLGRGRGRKRLVTESGAIVGFARPDRVWIDSATGDLTFEVTPSRYHDAWRITFSALQMGPVDWVMGKLLDRGLELLPGRLSARVRLPVALIRSADRDVVIVSGETAEWIERHFQKLEADARAHLEQVRAGVEKARPHLERARDTGVQLARPHLERARPHLERARDAGAEIARRSADAVRTRVRPGGVTGGEAAIDLESNELPAKGGNGDSGVA
jgi:hypothetical protein